MTLKICRQTCTTLGTQGRARGMTIVTWGCSLRTRGGEEKTMEFASDSECGNYTVREEGGPIGETLIKTFRTDAKRLIELSASRSVLNELALATRFTPAGANPVKQHFFDELTSHSSSSAFFVFTVRTSGRKWRELRNRQHETLVHVLTRSIKLRATGNTETGANVKEKKGCPREGHVSRHRYFSKI